MIGKCYKRHRAAEFYAAHGQLNEAARTNMRAFGIAQKSEPAVSVRLERLLTGQAAVFRGLGIHDTARVMEAGSLTNAFVRACAPREP